MCLLRPGFVHPVDEWDPRSQWFITRPSPCHGNFSEPLGGRVRSSVNVKPRSATIELRAILAKTNKMQRARKKKAGDVALVVGQTEDRKGYQVLRKRADDDTVEMGTVRPLEEGKPIEGEVVGMKQRKEHPMLFDVETHFDPNEAEPKLARGVGPAKVATEKYRQGWDAIWGKRKRPPQELN